MQSSSDCRPIGSNRKPRLDGAVAPDLIARFQSTCSSAQSCFMLVGKYNPLHRTRASRCEQLSVVKVTDLPSRRKKSVHQGVP